VTWIRISVLAAVFVVVTVLSLSRLDTGPGKPVVMKYGATSQGQKFQVQIDDDGRPVAFATSLTAICPDGHMVPMPWSPADGEAVHFKRDGDRLRVAEWGDGWRQELDAQVGRGGSVRGTMTLVVHVRPKTRAPFDCASPKVRVTAGR